MMEKDSDIEVGREPARKFRNIVFSYMHNRLPRDIHPSFQQIDQTVARDPIPRPALPSVSHTEPVLFGKTVLENDNDSHETGTVFSSEALGDLYKEADSENLRFQSIVEAYEKNVDAKYRTHINLNVSHSWDQVLNEVDTVTCQYKERSRFWGKVRRGLKRFGENEDAFNAWLGLLPTQSNYCSIICGGLKLVIQAAARFNEVRESVFETLSEIPLHLCNTKLVTSIFKPSKELHERSSELYISVLAALAHIVEWFKKKALRKFSKALFKQDAYETELTQKFAAIKTSSARFAQAATICSYQKQNDVHRDVVQNRLAIERYQSESALEFLSLGEAIKGEHRETRQDIDLKLAMLESQNQALTRSNIEMTSRMDVLIYQFLSSNSRINRKTGDLREPSLPLKHASPRIARIKKQRQYIDAALETLDFESSILATDIEAMLSIAWKLPKPAQNRAVSLMQSPKLQTWIQVHSSSMLFINGNSSCSPRQNPLSFICAKLMDSIQSASSNTTSQTSPRGILAHGFFCGLHLNGKDPDAGVAGMMQSLLAQLLVSYENLKLATIDKFRLINPANVAALCTIYYDLILQLPADCMVFSIIDAMTFHEDNKARCRDALNVVQTLADLTAACVGDEHCIFKVLLTCPGTSRSLYKEMAKEDVIWMPSKVGVQGGFTSMKWNSSVGKTVSDLDTQSD